MRCLLILVGILPQWLLAQGEPLSVAGISLTYKCVGDSLELRLSAPTTGWVGLGFNTKDDIVGSDLLLFRVINGQTEVADMYVVGFGDPRTDEALGGQASVRIVNGSERAGETSVTFRIAGQSRDAYDFQHREGEKLWLILAYSTHDDFAHHSRVRRHVHHQF